MNIDADLRLLTAKQLSENAFSRMIDDYSDAGIPFLGMTSRLDFNEFVKTCTAHASGRALPDDMSPYTRYFLCDENGTIFAQGDIRHRPTEAQLTYEGQLGYGTLPFYRNNGYAKIICALLLDKLRQRGFERVLITCNADNIPSRHVIEHNGGVLEDIRYWPRNDSYMRRYWVTFNPSRE